MANFRLLLVDDLPENLQALATSLEGAGYDMAFALSGEEALERCEQTPFDLILLDLMLPGIDGLEVFRRLRAQPKTAGIPVVFVSAKHDQEANLQALELGAADYLTKPFDKRELLLKVRNQLELRSARLALEEATQIKDRFLSLLAHDLKAPFGLISHQAEISLKGSVPEGPLKSGLWTILKSARSGLDLIEQLLAWGRSHQGTLPFRPSRLNLYETANRVARHLEDQAQGKQVHLSLELDRETWAWGDREMIEAILRNLISNGIKYSNAGDYVSVRARTEEGGVTLKVCDQGKGIAPERLAQLFSALPQRPTEGTAGERGSGLGLSLAQALAKHHQTSIQAQSTPGKGSCFSFTLPLEPF